MTVTVALRTSRSGGDQRVGLSKTSFQDQFAFAPPDRSPHRFDILDPIVGQVALQQSEAILVRFDCYHAATLDIAREPHVTEPKKSAAIEHDIVRLGPERFDQ